MSATKTAVAAATAAKAPETKPEGKTAVLNAAQTPQPPKEQKKPSFEELRKFYDKVAHLNTRWQRLNESAKELDSLSLREDGRQPSITIYGSDGEKWQTTNTRFISHVIKVMGEEMTKRMDEVQAEIVEMSL